MSRLIVLDTETTGIEPSEGHRIIEIGCTEIVNREIIESNEYHQYIQPERLVGDSERIHGIKDSFLKNKPKFEEIAEEFLEYIEGATLVIHNAPFDLGFLNHELQRMGVEQTIEDNCTVIDSLEISKQQRPGGMHNLDALCRRFEIDASARTVHGALLDAQILAQVYLAMTGGQSTLFNENQNSQQNSKVTISRVDSNRAKIKVVLANKEELKAHNTYFEHS
ncbi:DNA polymerase III epsilon subunit (EC [uncultured Gammaproteobacteria bacterium]|jgi:DNA polymerase-3 subunit epsilon|uniref:DNA polymerase III subunit epsilon n=1 Tax=thiotrophic endosymbiont of Bathymodiolus puteoserpentis (Logatchev) TaxID=343240 RepID=UPI0010AF52ED|nr:DNA polymerase III subunit epsilon [thiotrophic endosymbiont of Bathymodiolus puteoserpentis (Logatchev)]CAC9570826.1 DNA polymerase III epsilon subunit (EC 2.7.7.7) [uncultured Gammaproteobacteria bacterium]CAC9636153.1 DNA polymerase III epsilon subunit (EC 2.7.7.7) [uncultured Gammaproteobacteria bacterium]SSC10335.1 DNA polymerase III epsilon subunit [thiotrophic endosymbiont of Bathymodiolus puteoserpentis (Logatchev)]VVH50438.1 DNA polymerase III epsilon subunit (EC [uncultured Gammapr